MYQGPKEKYREKIFQVTKEPDGTNTVIVDGKEGKKSTEDKLKEKTLCHEKNLKLFAKQKEGTIGEADAPNLKPKRSHRTLHHR